jgi:hypothetical protein
MIPENTKKTAFWMLILDAFNVTLMEGKNSIPRGDLFFCLFVSKTQYVYACFSQIAL